MPVGKIYPEDFTGRANRHDHADRLVFHILGTIDEFHGLVRSAVGAGDDLGQAASHPGVGETAVTPTPLRGSMPPRARQVTASGNNEGYAKLSLKK